MYDWAVLEAWIEFAVRWTHVITAVAWIGSSFYFIALDLGLRKSPDLPPGAYGEEWQVHGGGFYHVQKYLVAPDRLPDHLIWFKWESYTTWLSGFALLVLVYYLGADLYLVDPAVADLAVWQAVLISLASLGFGWLAYDAICKSRLGNGNTRVHRHDHVGQCVHGHHAEPAHRGGRPQGRPCAGPDVWPHRQAAQHA